MNIYDMSCKEFSDELASKAAVPGGGGASAFVGSLGAALGSMVCNLTLGKKKYAEVQDRIENITARAEELREGLAVLVGRDAAAFEPLSKAYGLPSSTDAEKLEKEKIMEAALREACGVPIEIMEACLQAIKLHGELLPIGSRLAISDVGVGVLLCRAALCGASLNVYINTKSMKDRSFAEKINERADSMIQAGCAEADRIYSGVLDAIK